MPIKINYTKKEVIDWDKEVARLEKELSVAKLMQMGVQKTSIDTSKWTWSVPVYTLQSFGKTKI